MKLVSIYRAVIAASIIWSLVACGGGGGGGSDSNSDGITPAASTGANQNVKTNSLVTLDGSKSSDPQGKSLTFSWMFLEKPEGSKAALSDPFSVKPTFTPDLDGIYIIGLVVSNGAEESSESLTTITASSKNSAPVADAGADKNVPTGMLLTLDGSESSDADGDQLTYFWELLSSPTGSGAALSDINAVKPTFTPDVDGEYVFRLAVNDGTVGSSPATVTFTATRTNVAPIANAGVDKVVATGSAVTLDGSGSSDVDGDQLTYSWDFVSKPSGSGATLSDKTAAKPIFTPDKDGDYVLRLVVNDGETSSEAATMTVSAASNKIFLSAEVTDPSGVQLTQPVNLNKNPSFDLRFKVRQSNGINVELKYLNTMGAINCGNSFGTIGGCYQDAYFECDLKSNIGGPYLLCQNNLGVGTPSTHFILSSNFNLKLTANDFNNPLSTETETVAFSFSY